MHSFFWSSNIYGGQRMAGPLMGGGYIYIYHNYSEYSCRVETNLVLLYCTVQLVIAFW